MSIEIDSEQGVCSVEIEGSRHRAPVDSLRIGTDAEARLSVLYIDGKRLHISEEDAQRPSGWWSPAPRTSAGT